MTQSSIAPTDIPSVTHISQPAPTLDLKGLEIPNDGPSHFLSAAAWADDHPRALASSCSSLSEDGWSHVVVASDTTADASTLGLSKNSIGSGNTQRGSRATRQKETGSSKSKQMPLNVDQNKSKRSTRAHHQAPESITIDRAAEADEMLDMISARTERPYFLSLASNDQGRAAALGLDVDMLATVAERSRNTETIFVPSVNRARTLTPDKQMNGAQIPSRHRLRSLVRKQTRVTDFRIRVRQSRAAQRIERTGLGDNDREFTDELRMFMIERREVIPANLQARYESLVQARENLHQTEYEYDLLENTLNQEEFELEVAEDNLADLSPDAQKEQIENDEASSFPLTETSSYSDHLTLEAEQSPLMKLYEDSKGELDLIKEELMERRAYRARLHADEQALNQVGRGLDDEALDFLASFDLRQKELEVEMDHMHQEQQRLLEEMDAERSETAVVDEGTVIEPLRLLQDSISSSQATPSSAEVPQKATVAIDEPLLLKPRLLETQGSPSPERPQGAGDDPITASRTINAWLLDSLRWSRLEILRFKLTSQLLALSLNAQDLKELVLTWWDKDATGEGLQSEDIPVSAISALPNDSSNAKTQRPQSDTVLISINRLTLQLRARNYFLCELGEEQLRVRDQIGVDAIYGRIISKSA